MNINLEVYFSDLVLNDGTVVACKDYLSNNQISEYDRRNYDDFLKKNNVKDIIFKDYTMLDIITEFGANASLADMTFFSDIHDFTPIVYLSIKSSC